MRKSTRFFLFGALALIGVLALAGTQKVQACGGFFCQNTPINQNAERIIFLMNEKEQQVSAIVGINYVGDAKDFSWVVPVPNKPTVDVLEQSTINALNMSTSVNIFAPRNYCVYVQPFLGGFGGGGGGGGELGSVGPYDYAIIQNDDPAALIKWLRDNGFRVPKEIEPVIGIYVKEKQYFVAFKLKKDEGTDSIQPVKLTYHSTYASIPLRLTAVAAVNDMPVLVWIFGATQYVPQNYAHPKIDYSTWRAAGRLANSSTTPISYFHNPNSLYNAALKDIQTKYRGQAFITEMARPSQILSSIDDPGVKDLLTEYSYVTRLRAQLSASEMIKDPVFVAQPGLVEVSNVINLDATPEIDPLTYWGCSSRSVLTEDTRANLPAGRTHIDSLKLHVAHPTNWKMSSFNVPERDNPSEFMAFSSKPVTRQSIEDFFVGRSTAPMLIAAHVAFSGGDDEYSGLFDNYAPSQVALTRVLLKQLELDPTEQNLTRLAVDKHIPLAFRYDIGNRSEGVLIALLAQPGYWNVNPKLYDAMVTYAASYQYYARADWEHTLLLNDPLSSTMAGIPFPTGWIEKTLEGDAAIVLEKSTNTESGPFFRVTPFGVVGGKDLTQEQVNAGQERLAKLYGEIKTDIAGEPVKCLNGVNSHDKYPFEHGGNKGYVVITNWGTVGISAPTAQFEQYKDTLNIMLEAYVQEMICTRLS